MFVVTNSPGAVTFVLAQTVRWMRWALSQVHRGLPVVASGDLSHHQFASLLSCAGARSGAA